MAPEVCRCSRAARVNRPAASAGHADRRPSWRLRPRLRLAIRLGSYVRLEVLRTLRSRQYQILAVALPVSLYLLSTQPGLGRSPTVMVDGGAWSAAALDQMATLGALGAALATGGSRLATDRADGWIRTLGLAPLPPGQMLTGRVVAGVVGAGLPILLVIGIGVVAHGVALPVGRWLQLIGSLWIGALPFALLGIVVGLSLGRGAAIGAVLVIYLGLAALGGLLEPIASLPTVIGTIGRALPSFLVRDLGWRAALGQGPSAQDATVLAAESFALGSLVFWKRHSA